ncbi:uncharacterized protein FOBCDRAFT_279441 [Fusarium oxysporum Fo47]|uniref:BTB domain-containing protein n=1 Tax=Fusarium oxysporum Fo47 TaxID=660027 RepID=W9JV30_FUSOX|nr:uncharacterized protein FOBCDRAFT_279441 [Fusarium oxysporum Fo47]EWZ35926.1 hypothetical protein FOZG_11709 [Fusarium oxysporum Fo47]WJG36148.1 hypothetical protein FOBCDRAFT_279441 [Fusarium oxysporum Fo47]
MSSESENNVPDEVAIPNGDIILVVGQEKLRIQVSSQFLTLASPVFDAMLNLTFSEGIKLHESNELLVDIKLPEDDGLATAQALKTIYGQTQACYSSTPMRSRKSPFWQTTNLDQAWKLMTASYWLNLEDSFRTMSEHVVVKMNHAQIFRLAQQTHDVGLGLKLGMALLLLHHALSQHIAHPKGGQCLCCFKITADDPVGMQPGCPNPSNHLSG